MNCQPTQSPVHLALRRLVAAIVVALTVASFPITASAETPTADDALFGETTLGVTARRTPAPPTNCQVLRSLFSNCRRGVAFSSDGGERREFVVAARRHVRMRGDRWLIAALHGSCTGGSCVVNSSGAKLGVAVYRLSPRGWVLRAIDAELDEIGSFGTSDRDAIRIVPFRSSAVVVAGSRSAQMGYFGNFDNYLGVTPRGIRALGRVTTSEEFVGIFGEHYAWSGTTQLEPGPGVFPDVVLRSRGTHVVDGEVEPRPAVERYRVRNGEYRPVLR